MKQKFTKEYLTQELDLPYSDNVVEDTITRHTRWSVVHSLVFSDNGKFWRTTYSVGATEEQDERPWEYSEEVECEQVERKQVLVDQWMPVSDQV